MNDMTDGTVTLDEAPPRRLVRVDEGRWLGGVSEGLGRYFDISPLVYRIAFAALALVGGAGILLYLAAWLVIPHETREESIAVEALRERREQPWLLVGVGLLAFGALLAVSEADIWPGAELVWILAAITGASIVGTEVARRGGERRSAGPMQATATTVSSRPAPRPRRPSLFLPVVGSLLAGAGVLGLLDVADVWDVSVTVALAAGLAVVGGAVAVGAIIDRRVGGLVVLGLVLLAGFTASALSPVSLSAGIGEKVARPLDTTELERTYELGIGDLTVDLRDVVLPPGRTKVEVDLGVGGLVVRVPENVALEIDGHAGVGQVTVLGQVDDGTGAHEHVDVPAPTPAAPVLELEADVGLGDLEVLRG